MSATEAANKAALFNRLHLDRVDFNYVPVLYSQAVGWIVHIQADLE